MTLMDNRFYPISVGYVPQYPCWAGCWVFWGKEVAGFGVVQVGVHWDVDDMVQV